MGKLVEFLDVGPLAQGFVHDELPLAGGIGQPRQKGVQRQLVEVPGKPQAVAADLQAADGLLQGFLVVLADAHHLAHRPHLGAETVFDALELLERPACELDHDVVAGWRVFLESTIAPVGDLVQGEPPGQKGGDPCDGEAGGLRSQRRGARGARVDLDHDDTPGPGVVGELNVGAADDFDGLHDGVRVVLQALLQRGVDGEHRGGAVAVPGVDPHGVHVFDEADGDHLVLGIADDFQLKLLPAQHRFLDQYLVDQAGGKPAVGDDSELFGVTDQAAAGAAHGVGGPDHHGVSQFGCHALGVLNAGDGLAGRHVDAEPVHGFLEGDAVLPALDGFHVDADHLDAVAVEHAGAVQLRGEVQPRLTAQVRQQGIRPLGGDDLRQNVQVERLDVGGVRHAGVGHDGGRVGVDQHDLVPECPQSLAGLRSRVVELAGLADHDRA